MATKQQITIAESGLENQESPIAAPQPDPAILGTRVIDPVMMYFTRFMTLMPNPDMLLAKTQQPLGIYREMLLDGKISSLIEIRKCSVLEHPRFLQPADDSPLAQEVCNFVKECYGQLNDYQDLKDLLSALEFGFSISEVIWELYQGKWYPMSLEYRKQERFGFMTDFSPYLLQDSARRPMNDACKFMVHRNGNSSENPYGQSVLAACYWPWLFKKAGWRFWLQAADKFGCPSVMALFDCNDTVEAQKRANTLAGMLAGIRSDSGLALANVKEVKALEMSGNLTGFNSLIQCANDEISYAITGQSLATGASQYGTQSLGQVHERIIDVITKADARSMAYTENKTLVNWIVLLNYGPDAPMPFWVYDFEEAATWQMVHDSINLGIPVSLEKIYTKYKLPKPKDVNDIFMKPPSFAPSPSRDTDTIEFADNASAESGVQSPEQNPDPGAAVAKKDDETEAALQEKFITAAAAEYQALIDDITKSLP